MQATFLDFVDKKENSDSQVDRVLDAIKELTLEFKDMKKHHKNIWDIAFQDAKKSTMLEALRKRKNIIEFAKVSTYFEWFYNEKCEIGIVRCKACFHLFLKPRLASMTPFEVYHFVNSSSFSSGMFYTKEKSRNMLSGGNNTWYHAKSLMIDYIYLIGKGSVKDQETQPLYEKLHIQQKKERSVLGNIFRATITTLKLGSGVHISKLYWQCLIVVVPRLVTQDIAA